MKTAIRKFAALCVATTILGGCANDSSRYPSLDIRPAERVQGTLTPVAPVPVPERPEVSAATLASLSSDARAAHQDFLAAAPEARRLADNAAGSAVGSDAWAAAQVALADLDSARSRSAISLGELDILYADARLANHVLDEIDEARDAVLALLSEEDRILADLRAKVQ